MRLTPVPPPRIPRCATCGSPPPRFGGIQLRTRREPKSSGGCSTLAWSGRRAPAAGRGESSRNSPVTTFFPRLLLSRTRGPPRISAYESRPRCPGRKPGPSSTPPGGSALALHLGRYAELRCPRPGDRNRRLGNTHDRWWTAKRDHRLSTGRFCRPRMHADQPAGVRSSSQQFSETTILPTSSRWATSAFRCGRPSAGCSGCASATTSSAGRRPTGCSGSQGVEMIVLGYNTPEVNIHHREPGPHLRMFHHRLSLQGSGAYQNADLGGGRGEVRRRGRQPPHRRLGDRLAERGRFVLRVRGRGRRTDRHRLRSRRGGPTWERHVFDFRAPTGGALRADHGTDRAGPYRF